MPRSRWFLSQVAENHLGSRCGGSTSGTGPISCANPEGVSACCYSETTEMRNRRSLGHGVVRRLNDTTNQQHFTEQHGIAEGFVNFHGFNTKRGPC